MSEHGKEGHGDGPGPNPGGGNEGGHGGDDHGHLVHVTIDGDSKRIQAKEYVVSDLKATLGVPPEKELDQIVDGTIRPLEDSGRIKIKGEERFISHVRSGGSS